MSTCGNKAGGGGPQPEKDKKPGGATKPNSTTTTTTKKPDKPEPIIWDDISSIADTDELSEPESDHSPTHVSEPADVPPPSSFLKDHEVLVKMYWMRHGFSHANLIQERSKALARQRKVGVHHSIASVNHITIRDPGLTVEGVQQSIVAGQKIASEGIQIVLSSALKRSSQTALAVAKSLAVDHITKIPFVAESGAGLDNKVSTPKKQFKDTKALFQSMSYAMPKSAVKDVNYAFVAQSKNKFLPSAGKSNIKKAYEFLGKNFVKICADFGITLSAGQTVKVLTVVHSHMMLKNLGPDKSLGEKKPRNVGCFEILYIANLKDHTFRPYTEGGKLVSFHHASRNLGMPRIVYRGAAPFSDEALIGMTVGKDKTLTGRMRNWFRRQVPVS